MPSRNWTKAELAASSRRVLSSSVRTSGNWMVTRTSEASQVPGTVLVTSTSYTTRSPTSAVASRNITGTVFRRNALRKWERGSPFRPKRVCRPALLRTKLNPLMRKKPYF